mgnify:CR=1 FL=1
MKDNLDLIIGIILFLGCVSIYYFAIIQPRDAILYEVIDCMGDDLSRESYDLCHEIRRPQHTYDYRAPPS